MSNAANVQIVIDPEKDVLPLVKRFIDFIGSNLSSIVWAEDGWKLYIEWEECPTITLRCDLADILNSISIPDCDEESLIDLIQLLEHTTQRIRKRHPTI